MVYYLPTYFQGSQNASPTRSGVLIFTTAILVAPTAVITGQSVERTGIYLYQNYLGWVLVVIGYATMSFLKANSSTAMGQGLQVVGAIGLGVLYSGPMFGILAPLKVEDNATALALMSYLRTFGQCVISSPLRGSNRRTDCDLTHRTFGITVGTTILQNGLLSKLPSDFLAQFPSGAEVSYAIIPIVHTLPEPLQTQVRVAFASSTQNIWYAAAGFGAAGLVATLFMKQITLSLAVDENWGFERREGSGASTPMSDIEKQISA